jgi:hypothetical protein
MRRKGLTALLLLLCAQVGCSSHHPILHPNAHLQNVGEQSSKEDVQECREVAKEAGASGGTGKTGTVAGHTATGAGVGAASGAVGGAITGSPGIGAAVGAATGATFGFLGSLFSSSPPNPAYVNIVNQCLAERGYEVAGWK